MFNLIAGTRSQPALHVKTLTWDNSFDHFNTFISFPHSQKSYLGISATQFIFLDRRFFTRMMSSKLFTWCMVLFAIPTWADSQPNMPYDLNTSKYCTYWYDNYQGASCIQVASDWATKPADFARWNPTLTATCGGWLDGFSYCVEAYGEPGSTPRSSSTTIAQATTTVKPVVTSIPTVSKNSAFSVKSSWGNGLTLDPFNSLNKLKNYIC